MFHERRNILVSNWFSSYSRGKNMYSLLDSKSAFINHLRNYEPKWKWARYHHGRATPTKIEKVAKPLVEFSTGAHKRKFWYIVKWRNDEPTKFGPIVTKWTFSSVCKIKIASNKICSIAFLKIYITVSTDTSACPSVRCSFSQKISHSINKCY